MKLLVGTLVPQSGRQICRRLFPALVPNMPRQCSESVGSFYVSDLVVFSESPDVNDWQLQAALADPHRP